MSGFSSLSPNALAFGASHQMPQQVSSGTQLQPNLPLTKTPYPYYIHTHTHTYIIYIYIYTYQDLATGLLRLLQT